MGIGDADQEPSRPLAKAITITKHGVPVAMLVPHPQSRRPEPAAAIEALREFRRRIKVDGLSLRELIEEGRP